MTPDELRTLAERVRDGIAWLPPVDRSREADDAMRLAEAVLAEHPADDGEPATDDWAESVGIPWWEGRRGQVARMMNGGGGVDVLIGEAVLLRNPTRRKVRLLCAALGVPLQEVK